MKIHYNWNKLSSLLKIFPHIHYRRLLGGEGDRPAPHTHKMEIAVTTNFEKAIIIIPKSLPTIPDAPDARLQRQHLLPRCEWNEWWVKIWEAATICQHVRRGELNHLENHSFHEVTGSKHCKCHQTMPPLTIHPGLGSGMSRGKPQPLEWRRGTHTCGLTGSERASWGLLPSKHWEGEKGNVSSCLGEISIISSSEAWGMRGGNK